MVSCQLFLSCNRLVDFIVTTCLYLQLSDTQLSGLITGRTNVETKNSVVVRGFRGGPAVKVKRGDGVRLKVKLYLVSFSLKETQKTWRVIDLLP